ncbi:MAG: PilZ domain-containing protein [Deltaproteobacteria bacterium]|jgi:hypothetical protein|nr:PilZ domain-containing protein [Deltaproteobacteria bacterium]
MKVIEVIVKDDVALISCPTCRKNRNISVGSFKETGKRNLKIKCDCEQIFGIFLECRKHFRKPAKLLGKSINLSNDRESHDIIIKNISAGGVGFCPFKSHGTRKDDYLQVSFILNDVEKTSIDTHVMVQSSTNEYVGCEFISTEKFKKPLDFYLFT